MSLVLGDWIGGREVTYLLIRFRLSTYICCHKIRFFTLSPSFYTPDINLTLLVSTAFAMRPHLVIGINRDGTRGFLWLTVVQSHYAEHFPSSVTIRGEVSGKPN